MDMGFVPTWRRHVSLLLHKTTLTTGAGDQKQGQEIFRGNCPMRLHGALSVHPRTPRLIWIMQLFSRVEPICHRWLD